jgi:hypothetical protein
MPILLAMQAIANFSPTVLCLSPRSLAKLAITLIGRILANKRRKLMTSPGYASYPLQSSYRLVMGGLPRRGVI